MTNKFSFSFKNEEGYNANARPYIYFGRPDDSDITDFKKFLFSPNHPKFLYLLNPSYDFDFFKHMDRPFTIITKNGSFKFNLDILKDTSTTIKDLLQNDPTILEYHLRNEDDQNIMLKIEQMYLGQKISISSQENSLFSQITYELNIIDHISLNSSSKSFIFSRSDNITRNFKINLSKFHSYIRTNLPQTFTIYTNNNKYKCNMIGIKSSNILNELLIKNPSLTEYKYDFDDEFGEFQQICDLFNFNFVKLTTDNMNSIKIISEDLQIDVLMNDLDSFIEDFEKRIQSIDDQQNLIDSIDDLFDLLYKIKEISVETVKNKIIETDWCKTEENVQELAAFILQVIQTDDLLQPYMVDLIEMLDKNANETNELKILAHFIEQKLLFLFGQNKLVSSFIFRLMQKGFIKKENILEVLNKSIKNERRITESYFIFIPELNEIYNNNLPKRIKKSNFFQSYYPNKIDDFIKMREKGEPDDLITKSIRLDDINTFQSIVSTNQIDITKATIPFNIFDDFDSNNEMSYINYSAVNGSLKCFKYLLLNHATIDESTFSFAVFGGNIEIVKIVDQQKITKVKSSSTIGFKFNFGGKESDDDKLSNTNINPLLSAIRKHQNDLFDWIFEHKFSDILQYKSLISNILFKASENGNSHSIINIINRGFDFSTFDRDFCHEIIKKSSEKGFYKFVKFLTIIMKNRLEQFDSLIPIFDPKSAVLFGNVSIFKLYVQKVSAINMEQFYSNAIKYENFSIVKYIIEKTKVNQNDRFIIKSLSDSIDNNTTDIFNYIFDKFVKMKSKQLSKKDLIDLLSKSCNLNKIEIAKKFTELILESYDKEIIDFTLPFYNATFPDGGSAELCQFFIDKKVYINFEMISSQALHLVNVKNEVLDIVIKNATLHAREIFNMFYLNEAIVSKNKYLIQILLNDKQPDDDSLFKAVKTGDIEIVNMILDKNSKPSFINQISEEGTAINIAVTNSYYDIFKRLLSIPGIDLGRNYNNSTPLINAVNRLNMKMVNDILDFYDPENKSFQKQLKEASTIFLKLVKSKNFRENELNNDILKFYYRLVAYEFIDVNQYIENYSLFSFACELNQVEIVRKLLSSNRVDVNLCPTNGDTPLLQAIVKKNIEIAKLLINNDEIDINHRNNYKETALTLSVSNELIEFVDLIMNNKNFDHIESRLDYAFYLSNEEIAKKLIKSKDIDVNYKFIVTKNFFNRSNNFIPEKSIYCLSNINILKLYNTSLYDAVRRSLSDKVDLIINHSSFDPEKSLAKESLFLSCKTGNIDIFKKLIKLCNNDINIVDSYNKSLFEVSLNENQLCIIEEIFNNENFDMKKIDFLSIFNSYIKNNDSIKFDVAQKIIEYDKNHDNLIDFKKLLPNGETYISSIAYYNDELPRLLDLFISNGADPNIPNQENIYPLEYAIAHEDIDYINALINTKKIDFSVKLDSEYSKRIRKDKYLYSDINLDLLVKKEYITYLHLAEYSRDIEIFSLLLQNNLIDINITDSLGETPLFEACRIKNVKVIQNLFQRDDLDYKHCNNDGDDALKISQKLFNNNGVLSPKSKDEYLNCLLQVIKKDSSNNDDIPNNNRNNSEVHEFRFNFNFRTNQ